MSFAAALAAPLHQQVENLAIVVDRPPEPELSAADQNRHFIEMPMRSRPRTSAAKFLGEQLPELKHPSPDRFIRDIQPALSQQILDIAEAEGEAKIQPHRVPNDVRWKLVASKRDRCRSPSFDADPKSRESSRVNSRSRL
jgi:hypothetical protein